MTCQSHPSDRTNLEKELGISELHLEFLKMTERILETHDGNWKINRKSKD